MKSKRLLVQRAIASASGHGINLCEGVLNPATGDCAFEAPILNVNHRSCFNDYFGMPVDHYRYKWLSEGEQILFNSDFNSGYSLKEWHLGFEQLKKHGVYEVDYFGDLVLPSIAIGMRKILLIFNTNTDFPREPVTLINPNQFGVVPTTESPIVMAYDLAHYESMHPVTREDDQKSINLVRVIMEGAYQFTYKDLHRLVDSQIFSHLYLNNHDKTEANKNRRKSTQTEISVKKTIKNIVVEEKMTNVKEKLEESQAKSSKNKDKVSQNVSNEISSQNKM